MLKNKKALIVDDKPTNIFALEAVLNSRGIKCEAVESGFSCLDKLRNDESIGIILMDIMMPEMDGYETIRRIRDNNLTSKLPIIAITGRAMITDKENCIQAGANAYISKPIDIFELLKLIEELTS